MPRFLINTWIYSILEKEKAAAASGKHPIAKYRMGPVQQIHVLPGGDNYCYKIVAPEHEVVLKEMSINAMNHPKMEPVGAETLANAAIPTNRFYPPIGC